MTEKVIVNVGYHTFSDDSTQELQFDLEKGSFFDMCNELLRLIEDNEPEPVYLDYVEPGIEY